MSSSLFLLIPSPTLPPLSRAVPHALLVLVRKPPDKFYTSIEN
jgi:hypothetical protein